jgi:Spy/CpxP family protein refolding chaperone
MMQNIANRVLCWAILASFAVALAAVRQPALAADTQGPVNEVLSKKGKGPRGRLPAHYAAVVNQQQREEIYKIQEEYRAQIELLETQLKDLKKKRDEKIQAVLTPEQKQQVDATSKTPKKSARKAEGAPAVPPPQPESTK